MIPTPTALRHFLTRDKTSQAHTFVIGTDGLT
jgi:hypothetical protein